MRLVSNLGKRIVQRVLGTAVPDHFVTSAPSPRHMVSLFEGGWASELPIPGVKSGASSLFDDDRIHWFLKSISGVRNARVLELGPLEGGHSCMLEQAGARQVVAVESNGRAWLKCLAVKETLGLSKVHFLLGDFVRYLEETQEVFDFSIACGVLYHLRDPHQLFPLLRRACRGPVMVWTMIWSDRIRVDHCELHRNFSSTRQIALPSGKTIVLHRHEYKRSILSAGFWGGNAAYSEWLSREDLIAAAESAGYWIEEVAFDEPLHPNGPALALLLKPI